MKRVLNTVVSQRYRSTVAATLGNLQEGDEEVPKPVGGRGKAHAGTPVAQGIQLSIDGPHKRAPTDGKRCDGQAGERDERRACLGSSHGILVIEGKVADKGVDAKK